MFAVDKNKCNRGLKKPWTLRRHKLLQPTFDIVVYVYVGGLLPINKEDRDRPIPSPQVVVVNVLTISSESL
jgi:hypothetical protein